MLNIAFNLKCIIIETIDSAADFDNLSELFSIVSMEIGLAVESDQACARSHIHTHTGEISRSLTQIGGKMAGKYKGVSHAECNVMKSFVRPMFNASQNNALIKYGATKQRAFGNE